MAHLTRFLMQDHARIFRALDACSKDPNSLPTALDACNEIETHMTIEEELVYPLLRDEIDGREADESEAEHAEAREMISAVRDLEPGDPSLSNLMQQIQFAVGEHIDHEETAVIPRLHEHLLAKEWDLGRIAFGMRQDLLGDNDRPKALSAARMNPNAGWTQGTVPLSGLVDPPPLVGTGVRVAGTTRHPAQRAARARHPAQRAARARQRARQVATAVAAAVVVAALAACDGGSRAGGAGQGSRTSTSAPGGTVGSAPDAAGRDEFCARVAESMAEGFGLGATNATSPEAMRQAFERSTAQGEATVAVAPAEIRSHLVVLGAAVAKLRDALAAVNYDISAVGPDAGILSTFSSAEVQQAAADTLAYVKGHCGADTGGVTGGAVPDQEKS